MEAPTHSFFLLVFFLPSLFIPFPLLVLVFLFFPTFFLSFSVFGFPFSPTFFLSSSVFFFSFSPSFFLFFCFSPYQVRPAEVDLRLTEFLQAAGLPQKTTRASWYLEHVNLSEGLPALDARVPIPSYLKFMPRRCVIVYSVV